MLKHLVAAIFLLFSLSASAETAPQACGEHFLGAEMPNVSHSRAQKSRLLCFSEYAVLHSALTKTPVWSAEHLTSERIETAGGLKRKNAFHAETRLPASERSELADYKGSPYDRGHMSPSGDMSTAQGQRESFSLANMIPQNPCNNEEIWEGIESAVRQLTSEEGEVYVVTGPIYPANAELKQIGNGVIVPTDIFKAIYVPTANAAGAYVIANADTKDWRPVSIEDLSKLTDIEVFPGLTANVKAVAMKLPPPLPLKFKCRLH